MKIGALYILHESRYRSGSWGALPGIVGKTITKPGFSATGLYYFFKSRIT